MFITFGLLARYIFGGLSPVPEDHSNNVEEVLVAWCFGFNLVCSYRGSRVVAHGFVLIEVMFRAPQTLAPKIGRSTRAADVWGKVFPCPKHQDFRAQA